MRITTIAWGMRRRYAGEVRCDLKDCINLSDDAAVMGVSKTYLKRVADSQYKARVLARGQECIPEPERTDQLDAGTALSFRHEA